MQATSAHSALPEQPPLPDPAIVSESASPLRIALLGYRGNPWSGGQGVYLKYLSRALVRQGHDVHVLSGQPYPHLDPGVRLVKVPGLDLFAAPNHVTALRPQHLLSATDFYEWFSMLTGGFAEPWAFGQRLRRIPGIDRDYDIIHDNQSLSWGVLGLQRRGVPTLATIHHPISADLELALAAARNRRERLLLRRWHAFLGMQRRVAQQLRHLVTVSERSRQDIAQAFGIDPQRLEVVYNGIDCEDFVALPGHQRQPDQLIATASADAPLKGLDVLLRALAQLRLTHPQVRLTLVGSPRPGGPTEQLIEQLGIGTAIQFYHGITTDQLCELYAASAVAVTPSLYEGFGLPAGEAMACEVPVVSSDGGALPEVVGDCGVVVPAGDPGALAQGIHELLENPERRHQLGCAGRQRILRKFSWDETARRMTSLYVRAAAGR